MYIYICIIFLLYVFSLIDFHLAFLCFCIVMHNVAFKSHGVNVDLALENSILIP